MEVLEEIVHLVVENCAPDKVILFGSYAYGSPTAASDIDICVVKSDLKYRIALQAELTEALVHLPAPVHVIALRSEQLTNAASASGALYDIIKHGRVLYDKTRN